MKGGKQQIVIDIDGVVAQYNFSRMLKKYFGVAIPNSWIYSHSIEDCLGLPSKDVWQMFLKEAKEPPDFVDGAIPALKELHRRHTLFIYTHRLKFMGLPQLREWLDRWGIPYDYIFFDDLVPKHSFDYHIDDSPQKLMDMNDTVKHKLLFDQPWNRRCKNITGKLRRVKGWQEVLEVINNARSS